MKQLYSNILTVLFVSGIIFSQKIMADSTSVSPSTLATKQYCCYPNNIELKEVYNNTNRGGSFYNLVDCSISQQGRESNQKHPAYSNTVANAVFTQVPNDDNARSRGDLNVGTRCNKMLVSQTCGYVASGTCRTTPATAP